MSIGYYILYLVLAFLGANLLEVCTGLGWDASVWISIAGTAIVMMTVYCAKVCKREDEEERERRAKLETEKNEKERERKQVLAGTWNFPAEELCRFCHENRSDNLDNGYALKKARAFIIQFFEKRGYTEDDCKAYLDINRIKAMLEAGEANYQKEEKDKHWELTRTRTANVNNGEKMYVARAESLANLRGEKKRIQMIQDLRDDYKTRIGQLIAAEQAMQTLTFLYAQQMKKESDWAIAGGIADGIAGPGAGVAAALNTMASNEQIRKHNDSMQSAAMAASKGQMEMAGNRYSLEKQLPVIEKDLEVAKTKIAFDYPSASEIWNDLDVVNCVLKKDEKTNVLNIEMQIRVKNQLPVNAPEGVETVVDGVLRGTVMCDDVMVGTIYLPLPIYGVPNQKSRDIKVEGIYDRYVNYQGTYKIKFDDTQNLWIMEA